MIVAGDHCSVQPIIGAESYDPEWLSFHCERFVFSASCRL